MERYFLGSNTAYGFRGKYEDELRDKSKVILLKGGPGTGKSSLLKRLYGEARGRGMDSELWYCSGDPASLDGVYIKELDAAIVDATAPHASGADLPKMKDYIFDLAQSLSQEKLAPHRAEIEALLKCKKRHFTRIYQHLKSALCHMQNQFELEGEGMKETDIRSYAAGLAYNLKEGTPAGKPRIRRLFTSVISPDGESEYFDHLRGKRIYKATGGLRATAIFFDELSKLLPSATLICNSLDDGIVDGIVVGQQAVVKDVGHFGQNVFEELDLSIYERFEDDDEIEAENAAMRSEIGAAKIELNKARELHLAAETYFVGAMDFANNDRMYEQIVKLLF